MFKKIAWILSHYLHSQWKFKLWPGKFAWVNKVKHCLALSTMLCLITSSKLSFQYFECSLKVKAIFLNIFYINIWIPFETFFFFLQTLIFLFTELEQLIRRLVKRKIPATLIWKFMVKMALMSRQKLLSLQGTKRSYVGPPCLNCIVWPMPDLCMRLKSSGSKMVAPSIRYIYDLYFLNSYTSRPGLNTSMIVLVWYWSKIIWLLCSLIHEICLNHIKLFQLCILIYAICKL